MLDTIIYIPTILAYMFIMLLIAILGFITIYVSHKIFLCIFDTLPVSHTPSLLDSTGTLSEAGDSRKVPLSARMATMKSYDSSVAALFMQDQLPTRKAKTALRIIVTLEPCYVAYVTFVYTSVRLMTTTSHRNSDATQPKRLSIMEPIVIDKKVVKYYDRLSEIPLGRVMQACMPVGGDVRVSDQSTDATSETSEHMQMMRQQQLQMQQQQQQETEEGENDVDQLFKDMFRAPRHTAPRVVVVRRTSK